MIDKPLVSICSPVYNGEKHLEDCIKSVLAQTYTNFEYIIVDNASTDKTSLIIERYKKKDTRIKAYRNDKTVCMEDNCNLCATHCSGDSEWIKFALADDYLFPDCVEKMVKVGESDDRIGIVSAYRMAGNIVTNMGLPIEQNVFDGPHILKQQLLRKLHVASSSPNTVMYRKRVFNELKGFNNTYDHSDTEMAFRLLDKYKLGFSHYVLTKSGREQGGGEYRSIMRGNKTREYLDFGYKNIKKYGSVDFEEHELKELRKYYTDEIADFIATKLGYFEWGDIKRLLAEIPEDIKEELKRTYMRHPFHFMKKYLKSLYKTGNYMKEKRARG